MTTSLTQLTHKVIHWAADRGILDHSTPQAQILKAVSEMGELADAVIKNDPEAAKDAVGDVLVCLINYCAMTGMTIHQCLEAAWDQIKDRKGRMVPGGAFVKEEPSTGGAEGITQ
jgi:NTP pyrophosphatase (non-canonical NTP hydrolase)